MADILMSISGAKNLHNFNIDFKTLFDKIKYFGVTFFMIKKNTRKLALKKVHNQPNYTIPELANLLGVTRQAIYVAMAKDRLSWFTKPSSTRKYITSQDAYDYIKSLNSRANLKDQHGHFVFNPSDSNYSVPMICREL